jgi:rhodanese-related sulfurtransferase
MKKIITLLLLLQVAVFAKAQMLYMADIDSVKAFEMQQEGVTLVDVRTIREYDAMHPKGAVNIPVYNEENGKRVFNEAFVYEIEKLLQNHDKPVILICRTGSRTKEAANILAKEGFEEVYNITNGFANDWVKVQLPVE